MYVYNIAKAYQNGGQVRMLQHIRGAKKRWFLFFYDESGLFHRKRITWYKAFYYKLFEPKLKWRIRTCQNCKTKYRVLGKSYCPNCGKVY